jgi:predicted nucleic acid-binding protein
MDRYAAVPMDFADASLVVLAQALDLNTALSTDRRGFSAYRATRGGAFRLLPRRA